MPPLSAHPLSYKCPKLAELAVESGFDWVQRQQDGVHVSVLPDSCESDIDLVFLLDGSARWAATLLLLYSICNPLVIA